MRPWLLALGLGFALEAADGLAAGLAIEGGAIAPDRPARAVYEPDVPIAGPVRWTLRWTDVLGRTVDERSGRTGPGPVNRLDFDLDPRRAVAALNTITLTLAGQDLDRTAQARFAATPPNQPWRDYEIISWPARTAPAWAALRGIGVTAGRLLARDRDLDIGSDRQPEAVMLANGIRWYEENIATDFYAAYHRWFPGKAVDWRYTELREAHRRNPADPAPFRRDPSLSDPVWLDGTAKRLAGLVKSHGHLRPLYYALADEAGIADLGTYWEFDFSDPSIAGFRQWLKDRYGSLDALNRQWDRQFSDWGQVGGTTARQALAGSGDNLSAWADFREWMDVAFARAVAVGRDAVRAADPTALAALEGCQAPGWGGYDYARLVDSVDLLELYDLWGNIDIVRSLRPDLPILTTAFEDGPAERRRIWRAALRGAHGLILWDENNAFARPDGTVGPRGVEARPLFGELRDGLGAMLINALPSRSPVMVHYSPASFRVGWMLDRMKDGGTGILTDGLAGHPPDRMTRLRHSVHAVLGELGHEVRYVSTPQVEGGELAAGGGRVLVLPDSMALSDAEALAIARFMDDGGLVVAIGLPGLFDQHGKRRPPGTLTKRLRDGAPGAAMLPRSLTEFAHGLEAGRADGLRRRFEHVLRTAGIEPRFRLTGPDGRSRRAEIRTMTNGDVDLVSVIGGPDPDGPAVLALPGPRQVFDLRNRRDLGRVDRVPLSLGQAEPTILALSPLAMPHVEVLAPQRATQGEMIQITVRRSGPSPDAVQTFRVEISNPAGQPVAHYTRTLHGHDGKARMDLPFALDDMPGDWQILASDRLTGRRHGATVHVQAR